MLTQCHPNSALACGLSLQAQTVSKVSTASVGDVFQDAEI